MFGKKKGKKLDQIDALEKGHTIIIKGDEMDHEDKQIPEAEIELISLFLEKFIYVSENTMITNSLDLKLTLRALPSKLDEYNVLRVELLNFSLIQRALISFQNQAQDELFTFYDHRSKMRLKKLNQKAMEMEDYSEELK